MACWAGMDGWPESIWEGALKKNTGENGGGLFVFRYPKYWIVYLLLRCLFLTPLPTGLCGGLYLWRAEMEMDAHGLETDRQTGRWTDRHNQAHTQYKHTHTHTRTSTSKQSPRHRRLTKKAAGIVIPLSDARLAADSSLTLGSQRHAMQPPLE